MWRFNQLARGFKTLIEYKPLRIKSLAYVETLQKTNAYIALPFIKKVETFFQKKRRYVYIALASIYAYYHRRLFNWIKKKKQNSIEKKKNRAIYKYIPQLKEYDQSDFQQSYLADEKMAAQLLSIFNEIDLSLIHI